jgi:outer membrane lipopolysaccharide assembly protein LptE/RlpB
LRRTLALLLAAAMLAGCGAGARGTDTTPPHVYKPNSNQNPDNSAP